MIHFTVPGTPIAKPRQTRRDKWAKRPCVVRYREWADKARECAGELPAAGDVMHVTVCAEFTPARSLSKAKRAALLGRAHRQSPDVDNIAKSVLDALWPDGDQAIPAVTCSKHWASEPGVTVWIEKTPKPGNET